MDTVLITGGTGSLGNALTRRLCDVAKKIIIFSRCELKQANMQVKFQACDNIRYLLGDVRDQARLEMALRGVDVCIHAAAQKRIESCSRNPLESTRTNVCGTDSVVRACLNQGVKKAVFVSTDKACEPATIYGGQKLVGEQMFINSNVLGSTIFSVIRYGNVYGSNGSLRHLFKQQAEDGVLSVTHQEMTRFFMTIDSACDLLFYCIDNMLGGEIFVPKMKSIEIMKFAEYFYPDVPVKIIGLRGHEKIHEKLISETEQDYVVKCNELYYKIVPVSANIPGIGWDKNYPKEKKEKGVRLSSDIAKRLTKNEIEQMETK